MGACPNQAEEEQQFAMTTTEALRLQLDNLQKEKHELQVRILKLSQTKPDAKAITEIETERDHWKEKYEGVVIENSQLKELYEKLLESTKGTSPVACDEGPQSIFELQEQLHQEVEAAQQWKNRCEGLNQELIKWKSQCALREVEVNKLKQECSELAGKLNKVEATIELECYRAEARVRKQWEAHEDRLVQQLKELQYQKQPKDVSVNASYTLTGPQNLHHILLVTTSQLRVYNGLM